MIEVTKEVLKEYGFRQNDFVHNAYERDNVSIRLFEGLHAFYTDKVMVDFIYLHELEALYLKHVGKPLTKISL